jgi:hypothetical protein
MTIIVKKIVNNFDNKWVRVLFHEVYSFKCLLMFSIPLKLHLISQNFDCKNFLIMLPDSAENIGFATTSDNVISVSLI